MLSKNIQTFIGCDSEYNDAKSVIFGAPFDGTTSNRPGTRFASKAIRNESFGIETYSPYTGKDLEDIAVFDGGELELPYGNTQKVLDIIESFTDKILKSDKIPFMIGGEHLVSLGAIRAAAKKYPDLHIVHFDAHTDLRDEYIGEKLSHASVIRRAWEIVGDGKIYQFGIRSGEKSEFLWAESHTFLNKFNFNGIEDMVNKLQGKPVYFTLDLDVLDPSQFPATGTPEAGGVSFGELLNAIIKLESLNVVACDINELSPVFDQSGISTALACKILREMLLIFNK